MTAKYFLLLTLLSVLLFSCGKDGSDGETIDNQPSVSENQSDTGNQNQSDADNPNHSDPDQPDQPSEPAETTIDLSKYPVFNQKSFIFDGIPDKYNTGSEESTSYFRLDETGYAGELYVLAKWNDNNVKYYEIHSYTSNYTDLPDEITIRDYDFSDGRMSVVCPDRYLSKKKVNFVNCKLKEFYNGNPYEENQMYFSFDHCTFTGKVGEVNITLNRCKIGGYVGDGMNPTKNFYCYNTFVHDLLPTANVECLHIDGAQMYGRKDCNGGEIRLDNVRFEFPSIHYDGYVDYCNGCIMFQLELGNVCNCSFENIICNGGGKYAPIYMTKGMPSGMFLQENISVKNIKVSDNFGSIFPVNNYDDQLKVENVDYFSNLYVSSVFVDNNQKMHIVCSNDSRLDKTLTIKTDKGEYSFEIPHCPSNWALAGETGNKRNPAESLIDSKGRPYTEYRYKDMPFDIDCTIDLSSKSIVCYDGDTEILNLQL